MGCRVVMSGDRRVNRRKLGHILVSTGNSILCGSMETDQLVWLVKVVCVNWLAAHHDLDWD